jgi:hypothetical protein
MIAAFFQGAARSRASTVPFVIFILFLGIVIAIGVYGYLQSEKRKEALLALAQRRGWSFRSDRNDGMENRYADFSCLQSGSGRYAYNILEGAVQQGRLCGFDYHYETQSTDSEGRTTTNHHHFSVVVIDTGLALKTLLIRPENFLDKIGEFFGFDDIDFESAEFSRRFCVKAQDRRFAFDVLHQATMEFLLAAPEFTIQFAGPFVMAHRNSLFQPVEFEKALDVLAGIIDRLPEYLLRELKGVGQ